MPLTFKEVSEILKLIDASQCDEVVLELEGTRLVVRRNTQAAAGSSPAPARTADPSEVPADATAETSTGGGASSTHERAAPSGEAGLTEVCAPMVGTFYRRPSPNEPPFVEEGSAVKKGDTLCLIEVMKLFMTIEAPADGTIASILPDDGALVEFNQLLFQIDA